MVPFLRLVLIAAASLATYNTFGSGILALSTAAGLLYRWWLLRRYYEPRDDVMAWSSWPGNANNPRTDDPVEAQGFQAAFDAKHPPTAPTTLDQDVRRFLLAALGGWVAAFALDLSWPLLIGVPIAAGVLYVAVDWNLRAILMFGPTYPYDD